jgi:hypothetical protein
MPNNLVPSFSETPANESSTLGDKISNSAIHLKDKASELGRKATDAIDENIASAAIGLDKAAATLHGKAENLNASGLAHAAADKLSATAGYFREHDVARIKEDLKTLAKNNPGPSLLVAGVIGFLVGRAFTSSKRD